MFAPYGIDDLDDSLSLDSVLGNAWNMSVGWHVPVDYELESLFGIDRIHTWNSLMGKITYANDVVEYGCAQSAFALFEPRSVEFTSQDGSVGELAPGAAGNRNDMNAKLDSDSCTYGNMASYRSIQAQPNTTVSKTTNVEIFDLFSDPSSVFLAWAQTTTYPDKPTDLTATHGNASATLSWVAPTDTGGAAITDYIVRYRIIGDNWTHVNIGSTATTYTVTGLTNGADYRFQIAAVNSVERSDYSDSASATPRTVPDVPANLAATPDGAMVDLSWDTPFDGGTAITDYVVEYKAASASQWSTFADGVHSSPSATITDLTNGTRYEFRVSAVNSVDIGPSSGVISATPRTVPGTPTDLSAKINNSAVYLSWTAPSDNGGAAITDYIVEYRKIYGPWTVFEDGKSTATTGTISNLSIGVEHEFRIAAVNSVGTSPPSGTEFITPELSLTPPIDLTANPGNLSVSLSWTAPFGIDDVTVSDYMEQVIREYIEVTPSDIYNLRITDYIVEYKAASASQWITFADGTSTGTTATVTGLANGIKYNFRVSAVNVAGVGSPSIVSATPILPITVPGAPTGLTATSGNAQVSLSWTAPAGTGGSAITDYAIQYKIASASQWSTFADGTSTGTTATVPGLTNGTTYQFRISTVNSAGNSTPSAVASATPILPITVPGAPTGLTATSGNAQVSLSWTAPAGTGGSAITDYAIQYKIASASQWSTFADGTSTGTTATVPGLTNGTTYQFRISTVNSAGNSTPSVVASATPILPITVPGAPTGLTATSGNAQVSLSWTAPAGTGGSAITDYAIQYKIASASQWSTFADGTSTGTTATVPGLTNGTTYQFRISTVNSAGNSTPSAVASATPILPITVPGAPTGLTATSGNAQVSLSWTAPAGTGGSAITDYAIQYKIASASQWSTFADGTSTGTTATVPGLTNGTTYQFRISTVNSAGNSTPSVVASATPILPITVPGAPTGLTATSGNAQVSLSWTAPAGTGGSAITDYAIQYKIASASQWSTFADGTSTGTTATVPGLTNGTTYQFRISAVNSAGNSTPSVVASATPILPITVPGAPTGLTATSGNAQVSLSWTAPAGTGGSAITDYAIQYKIASASQWSTFADGTSTGTTATVPGLANGTEYQFRISTVNSAGSSTPSVVASATPILPITVPGAPTGLTATSGNAQVSLSWTAPAGTGGSAITDYAIQYKAASAFLWSTFSDGTSTGTTATVTGLANGIKHNFRVSAVNAVGVGSPSIIASATSTPPPIPSATPILPITVPGAPTGLTATSGNAQVSLSWTAPAGTGGSAITDYAIQYKAASAFLWSTFSDGTSTGTTATVTGLANGIKHNFRVSAVNAVGVGSPSIIASATSTPPPIPSATPILPITVPGAPTGLTATSGNAQVSLSWTAPAGTGGSAIRPHLTMPYNTKLQAHPNGVRLQMVQARVPLQLSQDSQTEPPTSSGLVR